MVELNVRAGAREFERRFKGRIVTPDSDRYDKARSVWNMDADKRPAAIVQPLDVADVVTAVRFAREADLLTAVRCGGHSYQGLSTCDEGLVIDLSAGLKSVVLDPVANTVRAQGGALLGMVDRATVPRGRVVPAGIVSHTGLAGLALGGGIGYLTRSFGMTCDQFLRLQVVTANGEIVWASEQENPDLFWALRGGGGNYGIVTEFEMKTHPLARLQSGPLLYPMDNAVDVIMELARIQQSAPRELSIWFGLAVKPAMLRLNLPAEQRLLFAQVTYRGNPQDEILREVRSCGKPLFDAIKEEDFLVLQSRLDEVAQHGVGWYMKSGHAKSLSADLVERMVSSSLEFQEIASPSVLREVQAISAIGGAASDVAEDATAYSGRAAQWHCAVEVGFTNSEERERVVSWTKQNWARTEEALDMRTSYVNFSFEEGQSALERVYGVEKLQRLRAVKAIYDRDNFFRMNTNITPARP